MTFEKTLFKKKKKNSSIIHNSQSVEATQVSMEAWMDKPNVVYTCNGILFSLKKEGNSDTCYDMNEPQRYYAEWNKPGISKDKYCMISCGDTM